MLPALPDKEFLLAEDLNAFDWFTRYIELNAKSDGLSQEVGNLVFTKVVELKCQNIILKQKMFAAVGEAFSSHVVGQVYNTWSSFSCPSHVELTDKT